MASIRRETVVKASPATVWDAMRDIGALHTRLVPGFVTDCKLEGNIRTVTFFNGMVVREVMVDVNDADRRVVWSATGGPLTHHNSSAQVFDDAGGGSRIVWITDLMPNTMAATVTGLVEKGLATMEKSLRVTTYEPDLYDFTTPDSVRGDLEWYRRKALERGGPILEVGAGTGRVSLALAQDGADVWALDASAEMLDRLRQKLEQEPSEVRKRVTVVQADMRTFELSERFALIISPFRAVLHNLTEEDQLACFRRVRAHLRPAGQFAFNVFHPSLEFMSHHAGGAAGTWRWAATFPREGGGFVVRSEAIRYETVRQILHAQLRFEEFDADGTLRRTFLHRLDLAYLYPPDLRRLLAAADFNEVAIAGGFDGKPFTHDTDELVIEAS